MGLCRRISLPSFGSVFSWRPISKNPHSVQRHCIKQILIHHQLGDIPQLLRSNPQLTLDEQSDIIHRFPNRMSSTELKALGQLASFFTEDESKENLEVYLYKQALLTPGDANEHYEIGCALHTLSELYPPIKYDLNFNKTLGQVIDDIYRLSDPQRMNLLNLLKAHSETMSMILNPKRCPWRAQFLQEIYGTLTLFQI